MRLTTVFLLMLGLCLLVETSVGQLVDGVYNPELEAHLKNAPWVDKQFEIDKNKHKGDANVMVRRGLIASRNAKIVQVYADSTGLNDGDTIEFYLVGEDSANGYEALSISFASPGDVREALMFIGMAPGEGVDYDALRFWPKGERVKIRVRGAGTNSNFKSVPLESLLWNCAEQKAVLSEGFVFTGSSFVPEDIDDKDSKRVLAADKFDPHSIISDYNESTSVLDVPFRAPKGDEYGDNTVNVKNKLKRGDLLMFTMRPEFTNQVKRVQEMRLYLGAGSTNVTTLADVDVALIDKTTGVTNNYSNLDELLVAFKAMVDDNKDPFVTLDFSRDLPLHICNLLALLLDSIDSAGGIRIEPPLKGDLYYRAFMPDERMRERDKRYIQPLELHLKLYDNKIDGTLIKVNEIWGTGNTPKLDPEIFPVSLHGGIKNAVDETKVKYPVLLVFPEGNITLGDLMDYIAPIRNSYKYINIYLPKKRDG